MQIEYVANCRGSYVMSEENLSSEMKISKMTLFKHIFPLKRISFLFFCHLLPSHILLHSCKELRETNFPRARPKKKRKFLIFSVLCTNFSHACEITIFSLLSRLHILPISRSYHCLKMINEIRKFSCGAASRK